MRGRLLALALGLVLALVAGELGLRAAAAIAGKRVEDYIPATVKAREAYPTIFYVPAPFLPYVLRASVNVMMNPWNEDGIGDRPEKWVDFRVNSWGGRGPEPAMPKPKGVVRIACVGGSTTFSVHNKEADSWARQLERRLNADAPAGRRFEVLNFGTPKATSPYSLVNLATKIIHLKPDIVIAYDGVNDFSNWRFLPLRHDYSSIIEPMQPIPGWVESVPAWTFRSYLGVFLVYQLALRKEENFAERPDAHRGPMDVPRGIEILLDNYRSMNGVARAHGARFVTATFHMMNRNDEFGLAATAFNRELLRWGAAEGVPVADLDGTIPHDDGTIHTDGCHLTPKGDGLIAERFAEVIRKDVLPLLPEVLP